MEAGPTDAQQRLSEELAFVSRKPHELSSSLEGSSYAPGSVLDALHILFHLLLTTGGKGEGMGLLSHLRVQAQKRSTR